MTRHGRVSVEGDALSSDVRTYFVYGLYDPAYPCVIRYVGSTHRLLKRYCEHMNGSSSGMFAAYWVNAIKSFGRLPQLAVLRIVHGSKADGVAAEWLEINARRQTLLNGMTVLADCKSHGVTSDEVWEYMRTISVAAELRLSYLCSHDRTDERTRRTALIAARNVVSMQARFSHIRVTEDDREWTLGLHALCSDVALRSAVSGVVEATQDLSDMLKTSRALKSARNRSRLLAATLTQGATS